MIFDQYSRYKACSDLLFAAGLTEENSLLDVGSGPECLLGRFVQGPNITYLDPLIENNDMPNRFNSDVFNKALDDRTYDFITAIDVLEHLQPDKRDDFLKRLSDLATKRLILAFPTSDSTDSIETDNWINEKYQKIYGKTYPWLDEHSEYGLPGLKDVVGKLNDLGWHCQAIGHGHAPWYRELLGYAVCVWEDPNLKNVIESVSEKFNRKFYSYEFIPPHYRQFVVASSSSMKPLDINNTGSVIEQSVHDEFRKLIQEAHALFFDASLQQHKKDSNLIVDLNKKIEEVSSWSRSQSKAISDRDNIISELNQSIEKVSQWGPSKSITIQKHKKIITSLYERLDEREKICHHERKEISVQNSRISKLEEELSSKQSELMKMSDWASGMAQELQIRNASIGIKIKHHVRSGIERLKPRLKNKYTQRIWDLYRSRIRLKQKAEKIEELCQSMRTNNGKIIIVFPVITWDFRWQRPQQIVTRLRDNGYAVLYLAMTLGTKKRKYENLDEAAEDLRFNLLDPHIHQIWLHSKNGINIYTDPLEEDDLSNVVRGLGAAIQQCETKEIVYLIQFPGWGKVALELKRLYGGKIVFDCMDDHEGFSNNSAAVLKVEKLITQKADLVITSSDLLEEKAKKINPCTIQVKNGTEYHHFSSPTPNGKLEHLNGHPIIGYHGAIAEWFDMDIIAHCAQARPDWSFVLIGATVGAETHKIEGINNIHLLGEKPYRELPGYLAYFDVCTIPFKIIPLTLATNPVKFYEYISSGKPVVSTALPEILQCRENCYIGKTKTEFLEQLESALDERNDEAKIRKRIQCAKNNSWDARVASILSNECFLCDS